MLILWKAQYGKLPYMRRQEGSETSIPSSLSSEEACRTLCPLRQGSARPSLTPGILHQISVFISITERPASAGVLEARNL